MGLSKRDLRKLLREDLDVAGAVLSIIVAALVAAFPPSSLAKWLYLLAGLSIFAALWLWGRRWASAQPASYFKPIHFGETVGSRTRGYLGISDPLVARAARGLANFEKARPEFVHAAPRNDEVDEVIQKLRQDGVAILYGGPGEGKSMTAYLAAYDTFRNEKRRPHLLNVDLLRAKSEHALSPDLIGHLDLLPGGRKLVLVDDGQKLPEGRREELMTLIREEARGDTLKVIWLETEFYEEAAGQPPSGHIRVKFGPFLERLINGFYKSSNVEIQRALQGRVEGLEEAIKMANAGKIRDPWHLAFVASGGEARVEKEIAALTIAETLVLFLISAHAVITGGGELTVVGLESLVQRVRELDIGWVKGEMPAGSVKDAVRRLQEHVHTPSTYRGASDRMPLIRVKDRRYIASLHYNFARAIVKATLQKRIDIADDLAKSLKVLLVENHGQCAYVGVLLWCLGGARAAAFVTTNENWFVDFVSAAAPEAMGKCARALAYLNEWDASAHGRLLGRLDLGRLAESMAGAGAGDFSRLASLLSALRDKRGALLDKMTGEQWKTLAGQAAQAKGGELGGLADLLGALRDKRAELLSRVTWGELADQAAQVKVNEFAELARLLSALPDKQDELLSRVERGELADQAAQAMVSEFGQIANLLNALQDKRGALLNKMTDEQWKALARQAAQAKVNEFAGLAHLLGALPDKREELLSKVEWGDFAGQVAQAKVNEFNQVANLLNALPDKRGALLNKMTNEQWKALADQMAQAKVNEFDQVANLLNALPDKRDELLSKVTWGQLADQAAQAKVNEFDQVGQLLNALPDKRGELLSRVTWGDLADQAAQAKVSEFDQVGQLLNALPDKRGALLNKMTDEQWKALADQAAQAKVSEFDQVGQLLNALLDKRGALLDKMTDEQWKALADRAAQASVSELPQVTALVKGLAARETAIAESTDGQPAEASAAIGDLAAGHSLHSLPDRRGLLLQHVNVGTLAETAAACRGEEIGPLTMFMAALDDERRSEIQRAVDWPSIVMRCPLRAETLLALGHCLKNVWEPVEQHAVDPSGQKRVALYLDKNRQQLEDAVRAAYKASPRRYGGVAEFLLNCHHVRACLALQITENTLLDAVAVDSFLVVPTNYRYVGRLIKAFYEISTEVATRFLRNHTVFGRILRSLDTHDWAGSVVEARHLVKAIIRASPRTWGQISKRIKADLKALDIPSIHAELAEEAAAGKKEADSSPRVAGSD